VERAINHEVERQIDLIESGGAVVQETRLYDSVKDQTRSMRSKEEANDYRYFPDPDLLPLVIEPAFVDAVRATLPELPDAKRARFVADYGLPDYDAGVLTSTRELADYYEAVVAQAPSDANFAANWVMGELAARLNEANLDITQSRVSAAQLAGLLVRISDETISGKIAKQVFEVLWTEGGDADAVIDRLGLRQITDSGALETIIDQIIADNPAQRDQYRAGKDKLFGFFVGQAMKATGGKANPAQLNELLRRKLDG
jgi:aspartyl-tRNA(Asn)/glutamyl-tRNA(Gln) amidotransferase subunit B